MSWRARLPPHRASVHPHRTSPLAKSRLARFQQLLQTAQSPPRLLLEEGSQTGPSHLSLPHHHLSAKSRETLCKRFNDDERSRRHLRGGGGRIGWRSTACSGPCAG